MRKKSLALVVAFLLLWPVSQADVEILFTTGDTIKGKEVRRDNNDYILTLYDGGEIRIPWPDVAEVRLIGKPEEPEKEDEDDTWIPNLAPGEPEVLAGEKVKPVTPDKAFEVFGEPSKFVESSYDPTWRPESALGPDALKDSESTWVQSSHDPNWQPESAYKKEEDWLKQDNAEFQQGASDPTWIPKDGFAEKNRKEKEFWS